MEQMIEFHTWSGERRFVNQYQAVSHQKAEVLNVLDVNPFNCGKISDTFSKDNELNNLSREAVRVSEIQDGINSKEFAQDKSKETTPNMLSNRLRDIER